MIIRCAEADTNEIYKILIGSILPRPIAWVSTVNRQGIHNLAPFSFFTVASVNPPVVCFTPTLKEVRQEGGAIVVPKDTVLNIKDTGEFVINIVSRSLAEAMNRTSKDVEEAVSEFELAGLTPSPALMVTPPRVRESLINFECKLLQVIQFGTEAGAGTLVLGEVLCINMDDQVYKNGLIDIDVLEPIGRLGGHFYTTTKDRFEILRPRRND